MTLLEDKQKLQLEKNAFDREKQKAKKEQQEMILNRKGKVRPRLSFEIKK